MSSPHRPSTALVARLSIAAVCGPALAVVTAPGAAASTEDSHVVEAGDTLSGIALANGTTVAAIADANGLADPRLVTVGQRLTLPETPSDSPTAGPAPAGDAPTVVVRAGDTLGHIALANGTTVTALAQANGLADPRLVTVGQRLTLPVATTTAAPATTGPQAPTVVVEPDDTLGVIAERAGVSLSDLLASSGVGLGDVIVPGQRITLPAPATAPLPPVSSTFAGRTYPAEVTAAATANRDALLAREAPSREAVRDLVAATASEMGVDPALALAVARQESGFNARAVSPANAVGAMQVIPASGRWAGTLVGRELDLLDPGDNAVAGVAMLRALLEATDGDEATTLASYYQGLASVRKNGFYDDTEAYVANVQALADQYR